MSGGRTKTRHGPGVPRALCGEKLPLELAIQPVALSREVPPLTHGLCHSGSPYGGGARLGVVHASLQKANVEVLWKPARSSNEPSKSGSRKQTARRSRRRFARRRWNRLVRNPAKLGGPPRAKPSPSNDKPRSALPNSNARSPSAMLGSRTHSESGPQALGTALKDKSDLLAKARAKWPLR